MTQKKVLFIFGLTCLQLLSFLSKVTAQTWNPAHAVGTLNGVYSFAYNQTPSPLVEIHAPATTTSGFVYQWEQSTTPTGSFTSISGATQSTYTFSGALTQATYFRRRTTYSSNGQFVYSNVVKVNVVSTNWEDVNYIREHTVTTSGISNWQAADQLPIGQKLVTTTYLDGLGRTVEKVSQETATPANTNDPWGDIVQFTEYDVYGRQTRGYLPYTTTSQSGKFKTSPATEQAQYHSTAYNETSAYSQIVFGNSPLNRPHTVKAPGSSWAASAGNIAQYEMNTVADNVKMFTIDYVQGNIPIDVNGSTEYSTYPANSLYKNVYNDVYGKQVVEFISKTGQLVLKKVQLADSPSDPYDGWICTYFVYDHFGLLRYQLEPEAVKYLSQNSWSFGSNGQSILNGLCFQYNYDEKGRVIWKRTPGALPLKMMYDVRDRVVLTQDGNQANLSIPQWTVTLYDDLDRAVLTALYNTSKSVATLQADINNAALSTNYTITNTSNTGGTTINVKSNMAPLSAADLNNSSTTTVLSYIFYDHYAFPNVKTFNSGYTNLTAYSNSDPNVQPIATSNRTLGMATGGKTRVLGTNSFLNSTTFYDERGSVVQTQQDNIRSGADISTVQYHFDGRILSTCSDHTTSGTGYTNFKILTKYEFDKIGRVTFIKKQFGSNAFKTVSSYAYDNMGRVKTKKLDPGYTGSGAAELEALQYSYNLHGQLTGINKDYALKAPGSYNKWGHFFGLYLGYDNKDNAFASARLNGQITGVLWNTQGDDAQRKYDYTYDNAGRLTKAAFTEQQHSGDGWSFAKMDFTVSGTNGKITYDLNGNLLNMLQKGVMPGQAPLTIDNLQYTYEAFSNRLLKVADAMTSLTINGLSGDFKDGSNGSANDYVYDNNGNVVIDLNKNAKDLNNQVGANGIRYNFLDKPDQIRIAGKGTISILYSASGEKLQRTFAPETGTATTTTYINQFVYQSSGTNPDMLAFITFEEGRVRVVTPTSQNNGYDLLTVDGNIDLPNGKRGAFDFFILDHQQNVRMVLSEETRYSSSTATMETARSATESAIFGQTGTNNEVEATRFAKPTGWTGNTTASVSRLGNLAGKNLGPNTLQKVMAGDLVAANVQYYYNQPASGNNNNLISTVLNNLVQAMANGPTSLMVKGSTTNINNQLNLDNGFRTAVQPSTGTGTTPLAYLTVLFFDERFNFISVADGGAYQQQVASSVGSNGASITLTGIKAPKNGYVYVYVSNQSDQPVYFDNMAVSIAQGHIIEENHYYAFGLKIASISSKKYSDNYDGEVKNNYGMQGAYSEMDDDIGWNDFTLRSYDPQVGRWMQQDPYQQFSSPYLGMGNDPANMIDPSGGIACPGTSPLMMFLDNAFFAVGNALQSVSNFITIAGRISAISQTGIVAAKAVQGSSMINKQMETQGVGMYPLYRTEDAAAIGWATTFGRYGKEGNIEYSGLFYRVNVGGTNYYGFTRAARFPDNPNDKYNPITQSPGPEEDHRDFHKPTLPPGAEIVGHIHIHYEGSAPENKHFSHGNMNSIGDWDIIKRNRYMSFYLLNNIGELKVMRNRFLHNSNRLIPIVIADNFYGYSTVTYKGKNLGKVRRPILTKQIPTMDHLTPVFLINPITGQVVPFERK